MNHHDPGTIAHEGLGIAAAATSLAQKKTLCLLRQ